MSVYLGTQLLSGIATNTISNAHCLLDFKWTDHELTDQSWLRADTFSWQDGTVYSDAYNHLVEDYNGGTSTTETVGSYTITYVLASDGHKITTDETNVANIYNESGVAWYYILDTANQRFKLPRTKYGFAGLRDEVGKYVPESLPNIKGEISAIAYSTGSGALFSDTTDPYAGTTNFNGYRGIKIDASRSSSTYQNNAPVQERATQMYLYFYVGQFSQSATEQTAGLNSSLFNGKVDLDAANLSTQGKYLVSRLAMPSNTNEVLTLGVNGSTYTAVANGLFCVGGTCTADLQMVNIVNESTHNSVVSFGKNGNSVETFALVKRGDSITIWYSIPTIRGRFLYAEGEV